MSIFPTITSENCVAYTGTHDNDTAQGWFSHAEEAQKILRKTVSEAVKLKAIMGMIRGVLSSTAAMAVVPMQDYLGLGSEARMNIPSTLGGTNWQWRMREGAASSELAGKIADLTVLYGRA
jgi:4-alpha-glucanotransferase